MGGSRKNQKEKKKSAVSFLKLSQSNGTKTKNLMSYWDMILALATSQLEKTGRRMAKIGYLRRIPEPSEKCGDAVSLFRRSEK